MHKDIDRKTLYDEVWQIPMIELAKRYRVSRPTIKWACEELAVPLPPQAYWIHRARGHLIAKPPPLSRDAERTTMPWKELLQRELKRRKRGRHQLNAAKRAQRQMLFEEAVVRGEFYEESERWQQAETIRRYLAELDRRVAAGGAPMDGYEKWREMADEYLTELCPANSRVFLGRSS
ncbi:hypothetical protein ACVCIC_25245 [Burkholderia glumae]|uniref:hypothetical protein n=1 Tax=Burkholderia glumae TaxID=337 RepID=UPI00215164FF|nr:hypothetical protein [Burkholderia glumae]